MASAPHGEFNEGSPIGSDKIPGEAKASGSSASGAQDLTDSTPPLGSQGVPGEAKASGSSTSGAQDLLPPSSIGDRMRLLTLTIPSAGVASNETAAMLPDLYWAHLASEFREKVEHLSQEFRSGNQPPIPQASGASASGPKPGPEAGEISVPQVDLDWILSMTPQELATIANTLGVSETGQTVSDMQTAVVGALLDEQAGAIKEEALEKGSTTPPPIGASSSGSISLEETYLAQLADVLGVSSPGQALPVMRAAVIGALLEKQGTGCTAPPPPRAAKTGASNSGSAPVPPPPSHRGSDAEEEHHPNPLQEDGSYGEYL